MSQQLEDKSAWFSSSVHDTVIETWLRAGGVIKNNALDAEYLFASDSNSKDVERLFKTKEFLTGHLAIFTPDLICAIINNVFNISDIREYIILPHKELTELKIIFPASKSCDVDKLRSNNDGDSAQVDEDMSTMCEALPLPMSPKSGNEIRNKTIDKENNTLYSVFESGVVLKDIRHLDDICVKSVDLMDFRPGVDGCRVDKIGRIKPYRKLGN